MWFNLFMKKEEMIPAMGTKQDRTEDLHDPSILFYKAMKWDTHYSRVSTIDDVV